MECLKYLIPTTRQDPLALKIYIYTPKYLLCLLSKKKYLQNKIGVGHFGKWRPKSPSPEYRDDYPTFSYSPVCNLLDAVGQTNHNQNFYGSGVPESAFRVVSYISVFIVKLLHATNN